MERNELSDEGPRSSVPEGDTLPSDSIGEASTLLQGERFRILRPHAEGGLGQVFLAEDTELCREVALKEIQPRHSFEPATRARFIKEARITGGLEHPGIVPVYALGTYDDGRPYYAMRFIRGDSLKDAIDQFHRRAGAAMPPVTPDRQPAPKATSTDPDATDPNVSGVTKALDDLRRRGVDTPRLSADFQSLAFRNLLRRFVDSCNALAYAHSRGVLHRDVKPNNIMLGPFGETLVVDWGLAKSIHEPSENPAGMLSSASSSSDNSLHTAPGSTVGTPAFMSPEQALGKLDELTPATDIYSLGATLYRLLSGRNAFENRDVAILLAQIERGEFARPRNVNPAIPPGLEAICRKAMALHPLDRYRTATALAEDVERWLADEPISAYGEPFRTRAGRWMRKHQSTVTGAIAAVCVGAVALGVGLSVLSSANVKLRRANDEANRAREAEASQRLLAQRRFEQAREAVDDYLADVNRDIRIRQNEPIALELRKALLEKAQANYEEFLKSAGDDEAIQRRVATASARLGGIVGELSPGPRVRELLDRARVIQEKLLAANPGDKTLTAESARTYRALGKRAAETGDMAVATDWFQKALVGWQKVTEGDSKSSYRSDLATAYADMATLAANRGEFAKALESLDKAKVIQEQLVGEHPDDVAEGVNLGKTYSNQGIYHIRTRNAAAAMAAFLKAQALQKSLVERNPGLVNISEELGRTTTNLANLAGMMGKPLDAVRGLTNAHEIFGRLTRDYPKVPRFAALDAAACNNAGYVLSTLGKPAEALPLFEQSRRIREKLVREFPTVDDYASDLASTLVNEGNLLRETGKVAASLASFGQAVDLLNRLLAKQGKNATVEEFLCNACWGRAESVSRLKRFAESLTDYDVALKHVSNSNRDELRIARAMTLARAGRHAEATREAEQLVGGKSLPPPMRYNLACTYAQASAAVAKDQAVPGKERQNLTERYAAKSFELLQTLQRSGFFKDSSTVAALKNDEDLESIRSSAGFKQLLADIAATKP